MKSQKTRPRKSVQDNFTRRTPMIYHIIKQSDYDKVKAGLRNLLIQLIYIPQYLHLRIMYIMLNRIYLFK